MKNKQKYGFTLIEIIVVVAIIGMLATIAIPSFIKARTDSQNRTCITNLKQIDGAKDIWAFANQQQKSATPSASDIQQYIGKGTSPMPICPADPAKTFATSYEINNLDTVPNCIASGRNEKHTLTK